MLFSRRIYFTILVYVLLILTVLGIGLWMVLFHIGYIIGSLFILCALYLMVKLTHELNFFNRKIKYFLNAVEDNDNMLYFPEHNMGKEQKQLNQSLNRINTLLSQVREKNQKQEHFYRSLLEEVPDGILAWNEYGKIIIANSAAHTLLGCQQLINRLQIEQLLKRKENLSLSQSRMKLQGEVITLLSIKDIGDELSDQESESWGKLTHVLTHEIMNTIAPIISLSQTLTTYPGIQKKVVSGLQIIHTQSERLMEFTESFRHFSYLPPPEKSLFSLTNLLHNLWELLQSDFTERNIYFTLQCQPLSIEMKGDKSQLSQVFLNLLKNSMQALEEKIDGKIDITVQQGDRLQIDISDNGAGIPYDIQEQIFIPFFTTKSTGTGIGLSLCKQIIRQHEGHLFMKKSSPGNTVFSIDLPLPYTEKED